MDMRRIWLSHTGSCTFATVGASRLPCGSARSAVTQQRSLRKQCVAAAQVEEKTDSESSALSLQSLWTRIATDASTLANIVPLGRSRSTPSDEPAVELQLREDQAAAGAVSMSASADAEQLESQLKDELETQGHTERSRQALRHWHSTRRHGSDNQKDQDQHPALAVLRQRLKDCSKPGARTDEFKLGLAVEGGGMRGCVTAGALRALDQLGVRDVFDAVYGSSAGAMNLTYFLSQQPEGADIYHQEIANERFCNMRRLLNRNEGPALDLSFLLNDVMEDLKPLDWDAVINSPIPLKVVASCLDTLQPIILEDFESTYDLQQCLRASAQVPAVAGDPIEHRGRRMVDAAVFEPVPFRAAISDGCTHVITLCSRPPTSQGWLAQMKEDLLGNLVKRAVLSPGYMKAAWRRELENLRAFGLTTDQMMMASLDPSSHEQAFLAGSYNFPVIPGDASRLSPISIDPATLRVGLAAGESAVRELLGEEATIPSANKEDSPFFDAGLVANGMEPYIPLVQLHTPQQQHALCPPARLPSIAVAGF